MLASFFTACSTQSVPLGSDSAPPSACESKPCDAGVSAVDATALSDAAVTPDFAVQEWGTYTSVVASDGHTLPGVHHVDEALPAWVHRRNLNGAPGYFMDSLPEEPRQQLETPVLYFWSKEKRDVEVTVNFPDGLIGEWYPEAKSYLPAIGGVSALAAGSMTWKVNLDPQWSSSKYQSVSKDEIWAPSRNVKSTPVVNGSESEQFIFYRGLGKFIAPISVKIDGNDVLSIHNDSDDAVAEVFVLRFTGEGGDVISGGSVGARQSISVNAPAPSKTADSYVATARNSLRNALQKTGLNLDVAQSMVDTWTRSWFHNTGLRVLYVAPRAWTDKWLPTTVSPTPDVFLRTLVGRVEVLNAAEEKDAVTKVRAFVSSPAAQDIAQAHTFIRTLGRFAEPRISRVIEQTTDPAELAAAKSLLTIAHSAD